MSGVGLLVAVTLVGVVGVLVAISGLLQPAPSLERTVAHLQRPADTDRGATTGSRWLQPISSIVRRHPRVLPTDAELALVGRPVEQHALLLVAASVAGFAVPTLLLWLLRTAGLIGLAWYAPLAISLAGAALGPVLVHSATIDEATRIRSDLRYQVSAYLDVVTMLLAGNTGYEGALEQAAHAGDGRLFVELRRRMREAGARGASLTDALRNTGRDLGLDELEQIASTAALSAAEGAPVARTLAAKCATLRSALATEQESEARLRTSRLTTPIVGMALIFMALVIYPALSLT
ncbi:MAG: type II secretion system F family protein [Ilumatobacter sp.]|nr:type II secretion system F family protein [Ilumatobacter sp.]